MCHDKNHKNMNIIIVYHSDQKIFTRTCVIIRYVGALKVVMTPPKNDGPDNIYYNLSHFLSKISKLIPTLTIFFYHKNRIKRRYYRSI